MLTLHLFHHIMLSRSLFFVTTVLTSMELTRTEWNWRRDSGYAVRFTEISAIFRTTATVVCSMAFRYLFPVSL